MSRHISTPRLDSYKALGITHHDQLIRAYHWNIALSCAIYPALQTLEVTLRNALDHAVITHHQPTATAPLASLKGDPFWFEKMVISVQNAYIARLKPYPKSFWIDATGTRIKFGPGESIIIDTRKEASKEKSVVTAQDIISRVSFGFWTNFFSKTYDDITNKHLLWPDMFAHVFPNAPAGFSYTDVHEIFKRIRLFRNRLSHHEPIWKFFHRSPNGSINYSQPVFGLNASLSLVQKQYDEILELIRWMSLDTYQMFVDAKMDINFKRLCSHDGFYSFVDREKIKNRMPVSRTKREFYRLAESMQDINVIYMKSNNKRGIILGVAEPNLP
jgi:hypothetical protein